MTYGNAVAYRPPDAGDRAPFSHDQAGVPPWGIPPVWPATVAPAAPHPPAEGAEPKS